MVVVVYNNLLVNNGLADKTSTEPAVGLNTAGQHRTLQDNRKKVTEV